jgi:hypothetical protein
MRPYLRKERGMGDGKMSRRGFLKLGVAGIWAAALLFLSGCLGGGEEDDDDDGGEEDD